MAPLTCGATCGVGIGELGALAPFTCAKLGIAGTGTTVVGTATTGDGI